MRLTFVRIGLAYRQYRCYSTVVNQSSPPLITLRPYQEECIQSRINALDAGIICCGVSLPTGSGKTVIFLNLLSRLQPPAETPNATQSLVLVNDIELARQTAVQATRLFPQWTVEIEQGSEHASGTADLYVNMLFFSVATL